MPGIFVDGGVVCWYSSSGEFALRRFSGLLGPRECRDLGGKLIALPGDRHDQSTIFGLLAQRFAQQKNVLRQITLFNKTTRPDRFEQFIFGDDPVGILGEEDE